MGEFIPQLLDEGKQPRVMLDYSGTLLHGLRQMGVDDVLEALRTITCDPRYRAARRMARLPVGPCRRARPRRCRTTGCTCGPGSITSPPSSGWRRSAACAASRRPRWPCPTTRTSPTSSSRRSRIAATVGAGAGAHGRAAGRTRACDSKHLPHRLVCTSSRGESASIIAIIKTQGSDTKLVAQMQPYYEARGLVAATLAGRPVPPLVTPDRRRRERRRDDERVPAQVP